MSSPLKVRKLAFKVADITDYGVSSGVTKILAGANIALTPASGIGAVTVATTGVAVLDGVPPTVDASGAAAGTATTASRSDHAHQLASPITGAVTVNVVADAISVGVPGEPTNRLTIEGGGRIRLGPGTGLLDTALRRSAAQQLQVETSGAGVLAELGFLLENLSSDPLAANTGFLFLGGAGSNRVGWATGVEIRRVLDSVNTDRRAAFNVGLGKSVASLSVTLSPAEANTTYTVRVETSWNSGHPWVSAKATTGFTINFPTNTPDALQTLSWSLGRIDNAAL